MKVSWQVTGVRQDAYAKAHPLEVEQVKPEDKRGTFLHPVEHGMPEERGENYEMTRQFQQPISVRVKSPSGMQPHR